MKNIEKILFFASLAIFFFFGSRPALANIEPVTENEFVKFCEQAACRKNVHIQLKKKDGTILDKTLDLEPPVIQEAFISVYAGETIYIEADETEEKPKNFVLVDKITKPEKTIVFKFWQDPKIGDGTSMVLKVENPFSKPLRYTMSMMPLDKEKLYKTSSCPVEPGKFVFENWPYPIFQVIFSHMHFLKAGEDMACKE